MVLRAALVLLSCCAWCQRSASQAADDAGRVAPSTTTGGGGGPFVSLRQPSSTTTGGGGGPFVNGGSPPGVLTASDCALRNATHAFGTSLAPHKGRYRALFDALQLSKCGVPAGGPPDLPWMPPVFGEEGALVFVDAAAGDDGKGTGSKQAPFR